MTLELAELSTIKLVLEARRLVAKHRAKKLLVPSHAELVDTLEAVARRLADRTGCQTSFLSGGPDI